MNIPKIKQKYSLLDNLIEGAQVIGKDYHYLYVNNTVLKHARLTEEEMLGGKMQKIYPGIEETTVFKKINDCTLTGVSQTLVTDFAFPDGRTGYFNLQFRKVEEGVLIFSMDVTEIFELNYNLKKQVEEKVMEITAQKKQLEELNTTKNKFFSIVAHDLKSPLNSTKGFTELLINHLHTLQEKEIVNIAKNLNESIEKSLTMAENIIEWGKLQMNEVTSVKNNVDLNQVLLFIVELFIHVSKEKRINVVLEAQENLSIMGDENQVRFIFRNLLHNALKFSHPNGEIKIKAQKKDDHHIEILVEDNGIGMTDEMVKSIFSINKKFSAVGTLGEKGTGFGLALVHQFVKLNDGNIEVKSKYGKGTVFKVVFNCWEQQRV